MSKKRKPRNRKRRNSHRHNQEFKLEDNITKDELHDILSGLISEEDIVGQKFLEELKNTDALDKYFEETAEQVEQIKTVIEQFFQMDDIFYEIDETDEGTYYIVPITSLSFDHYILETFVNKLTGNLQIRGALFKCPKEYLIPVKLLISDLNRDLAFGSFNFDDEFIYFRYSLINLDRELTVDNYAELLNLVSNIIEYSYPDLKRLVNGEFTPEEKTLIKANIKKLLNSLYK